MKKLLLPLIMLLLGVGSGVGAGLFLAPPPADDMAAEAEKEEAPEVEQTPEEVATNEFLKLSNQFLVPLVVDGEVAAIIVISLSIEVPAGAVDTVLAAEPKLRDGFLQVMFDHANVGGFSGNFTSGENMRVLREELLRSGRTAMGDKVVDVLILDIVRQDM